MYQDHAVTVACLNPPSLASFPPPSVHRSFQAGLRYDPEHSAIKKAHKQLRTLEKKTKAVSH